MSPVTPAAAELPADLARPVDQLRSPDPGVQARTFSALLPGLLGPALADVPCSYGRPGVRERG